MNKILLLITSLFFSTSIYALGQISGNIGVHMIIGNGCEITGGEALNFGNLDFGEHPNINNVIDATTNSTAVNNVTLGVNCTKGVSYHLTLSNGLQPEGTQRRMKGEKNEFIKYDLYKDATYSLLWNSKEILSNKGNGENRPLIIYGRVPKQVVPSAGTYLDMLTITLTW
ncbi:MAG: spore coat U domain-containing protein [Candidatus Dasytiphilus stammeri]